jgi:hypothetical protein
MANFFNRRYVYFIWPLEYLKKKNPVPTQRVTIIFIKLKSCNALLHMLLVCISIYLKSGLRYKLLILIHITWTLCIYVTKDAKIRVYLSIPEGVHDKKRLENTSIQHGKKHLRKVSGQNIINIVQA